MVHPPGERKGPQSAQQEILSVSADIWHSKNPVQAARAYLVQQHARNLLAAKRQPGKEASDHALSCLGFLLEDEYTHDSARIWQLIDDTIDVIAPLPGDTRILLTGVDANLLGLPARTFTEIIFHLLVSLTGEQVNQPDRTETGLRISYGNGQARISFDRPVDVQGSEFHQLINAGDVNWDGECLMVAAGPLTGQPPVRMLPTLLLARTDMQRASMTDRLAMLGVSASTNIAPSSVGLCITFDDEMPAYRSIRRQLSPAARIWCIGQRMIRSDDQQVPIAWPLNQRRLIAELEHLSAGPDQIPRSRFLIVDDNPANTKLLTRQLQELGHEVDLAESGEAAIEMTSRHDYKLIFMDIQMPGMDGVATTQQIQEKRDCRVIGLTAHATEEERQLYLDEGMQDVLIKPVRYQRLQELIRTSSAERPKAARQDAPDNLPVFDLELALANAGYRSEFAEEFLTLLIDELPRDQQEILDHLEDISKLRQAVHRLHGAVRFSGTPRLAGAVEKLESSLKSGDPVMIRQRVNLLIAEINALRTWFAANSTVFRSGHRDATA